MFPWWFLYAVEIPNVKIPVVSRHRSVRVAVIADASHFHFRSYKQRIKLYRCDVWDLVDRLSHVEFQAEMSKKKPMDNDVQLTGRLLSTIVSDAAWPLSRVHTLLTLHWSGSLHVFVRKIFLFGSTTSSLLRGVLQWSVLELIVFLLYTAHLLRLIEDTQLHLTSTRTTLKMCGLCAPVETSDLQQRITTCSAECY